MMLNIVMNYVLEKAFKWMLGQYSLADVLPVYTTQSHCHLGNVSRPYLTMSEPVWDNPHRHPSISLSVSLYPPDLFSLQSTPAFSLVWRASLIHKT